ncbi:MAG: hypothetical protein JO144_02585 [Actinobacteria bacterium]|nr:hypothetical protein [Actinomycetota bacterium]
MRAGGSRRFWAAAGALALLGTTAAVEPVPADAATPAGFVVPGYDVQLAVAQDRIFDAATNLGDDSVHVFDLTGRSLATIGGEPDVRVLTASRDGSRIFAALGNSQQVSVIDTASLTEVARYDVSGIGIPTQVAEAGDRLFVAGTVGPWELAVGVVDLSRPGSPPTPVYNGFSFSAQLVAFESSPGVSQFYVTSCSISGVCQLEHYDYTEQDGATLRQSDEISRPRGMALTADDGALFTSAGLDTMSVRDPADLSITATVPSAYSGTRISTAGRRLVEVGYDKLTDAGNEMQVRDLDGALTYGYRAGRALIPLTEPGNADVYAAVLGADMIWRVETLPGVLGTPSAPAKPQGLTAVAQPGGAIALGWAPAVPRELDAPSTYRLYRSSVAGSLGAGLARLPGTATSFRDTGLTTGGRYYYTLVASNAAGDGPGSDQATATADASAPRPVLTRPAAAVQSARAIAVSYSASDTGSGVAGYDVRYRVAAWNGGFGGYGYPAAWQHTMATAQTLTGTPGHEYCVGVRSRDRLGNLSAWTADRCTALPLDDRSLSAATSGWSRTSSTGSYLGTLTRTRTAGAQLRLTGAQTDRFALVVAQCPSCGSVALYLNNAYWRTVSTYAATTRRAVVLLQPPFSQRGTTITLRNVSAGRDLIVDGLAVLRS